MINRRRQASHTTSSERPRIIKAVAALMIVFGAAEAMTGVTHSFFGVPTSHAETVVWVNAAEGGLYAAGGILILAARAWVPTLAFVIIGALVANIVAQIVLVGAGVFRA